MNNYKLIQNSVQKKPLYALFENERFWNSHDNVVLKKNYVSRYKKYSEWSLCFDGNLLQTLKSVFNIQNPNEFELLFNKATHGRGNEINKMMTLHSSSLMPLLFFHAVSESNPVHFLLDGKRVGFTRYVPEEQNEVALNERNFSNVDVALYNDKERMVVLFESKFSEYLTPGSTHISLTTYYKSIYTELKSTFEKIGIEVADWNSYHTKIRTINGRKPRYCEGPKQMVSHFLGAKTECSRKYSGYKVFLGELLFDFDCFVEGANDCLKDYKKEVYNPLINTLQKLSNKTIELLPLMTYQELIKENSVFYSNLEQDIKDFYQLSIENK